MRFVYILLRARVHLEMHQDLSSLTDLVFDDELYGEVPQRVKAWCEGILQGPKGQEMVLACQSHIAPLLDVFKKLILDLQHTAAFKENDPDKFRTIKDFTSEKFDVPQALSTLSNLPKHEVCFNQNNLELCMFVR